MKNISLGQYYPTGSVIHRLDGRVKIILAVIHIIATFLCESLASFACLFVGTLVLVLMTRIPLGVVLRSVRAIVYILIITFILNAFFTVGEGEPLFSVWIFTLYIEGIWNAAFMALRILSLILGTSIFISYTTTPIQLTDSIESLLSPLKKLKLPVHDFAMMMSIALRFIPTISDETDRIMTAQKARGADFTTGSLIKRAKALIPVLVPLFVSAFRRADELATAMECRCYHGGEGRTKMTVPHLCARDIAAVGLMLAFGAALVLLNRVDFLYKMV
ncbi:MAG: energy-coupling factor transporter transmembrane protein EcfT [Clostridia bacterium]|nr:energy-coupling factor transporter transmembrane protein EcfT [Clostridia bacterium]